MSLRENRPHEERLIQEPLHVVFGLPVIGSSNWSRILLILSIGSVIVVCDLMDCDSLRKSPLDPLDGGSPLVGE